MAVEDYFIDIHYVDKTRQPDGTGGFKNAYKVGETFKGSVTKASASEQTVAGIRGQVQEQYTIITHDNNVLEKDDVLMFVNQDKKKTFLRVNENPTHTPEQSAQSHWKYCKASYFEPDLRVVE